MFNKFLVLAILLPVFANAQWQSLRWPPEQFLPVMTGITCFKKVGNTLLICGDQGLLVSPDNGVSWAKPSGLPASFKPVKVSDSAEGLLLTGAAPANRAWRNADFTGLQWVEIPNIPVTGARNNHFSRIGQHYFFSEHGSAVTLRRWETGSGIWTTISPNRPIARYTWHRDTLYANFKDDLRLYRSTDGGNTFVRISDLRMLGFQVTDRVIAGQLYDKRSPLDSLIALDSIVFSLNRGQNWQKVNAGFASPSYTMPIMKYDGNLYFGSFVTRHIYTYLLPQGRAIDTAYNAFFDLTLDHLREYGAVLPNCFLGFDTKGAYRACAPGEREILLADGSPPLPVGGLYVWRDSLFMSKGKEVFLTKNLSEKPRLLGPIAHGKQDIQPNYVYFRDTLFSLANNSFLQKYHVPTRRLSQQSTALPQTDTLLTAWGRSNHYLSGFYTGAPNPFIFYRPLRGRDWRNYYATAYASNADYVYGVRPSTGAPSPIFRFLPDGNIESYNPQAPVGLTQAIISRLFARDSILMALEKQPTGNDNWRLYIITNFSRNFRRINLGPIAKENILDVELNRGNLLALCQPSGLLLYNDLTEQWTPYNLGLPEVPVSLALLRDTFVVGTKRSGTFKRGVQPVYALSGRFFVDLDNDGIRDPGEPPTENVKIRSLRARADYFSTGNGSYRSPTDAVRDTHRVVLQNPLLRVIPEFAITNGADRQQDFAVQIRENARDMAVTLHEREIFRPGFSTAVMVRIDNQLLPQTNGVVRVRYPVAQVRFLRGEPFPALLDATNGVLEWRADVLQALRDTVFYVFFETRSTTTIGTAVQITADVRGDFPDANPVDNTFILNREVQGAYDPNDKLVSASRLIIQNQPRAEWLTYTMRFENTGNLPTVFVTLYDTLDATRLDVESLKFIHGSHPFSARIINGNILKVSFDPIYLPPTVVNVEPTIGHVTFTIRTKGPLSRPDLIRNRTGIYFDYNPVVLTKHALTRVDFPVDTDNPVDLKGLRLSPNPVRDALQVERSDSKNYPVRIDIFSVDGTALQTHTLSETHSVLDLSGCPDGLLMLRLETPEGFAWRKMVKMSE